MIQVSRWHQQPVEPSRQIAKLVENADSDSWDSHARDWHMYKQPPVTGQCQRRNHQAGNDPACKINRAGQRITQSYALHHAKVAQIAKIKEGQRVQQEADESNQRRTLAHLQENRAPRCATIDASTEGQCDGSADDKQKKWKNNIGDCAAVPNRMTKLRVGNSAISGVIDKNHESDGHAAEHVEREQTAACLLRALERWNRFPIE